MPTPKDYITNSREADLAERIWQLSARLPSYWKLHSTHEILNNSKLPWMTKRIIYARDWITSNRENDSQGGIRDVNKEFNTNFNAEEIGNIEHFYVSALLGTLGGPAGGVLLNVIAGVSWELVIGPTRIALTNGFSAVPKNYMHNISQLVGPNQQGMRFGSFYVFNSLAEQL